MGYETKLFVVDMRRTEHPQEFILINEKLQSVYKESITNLDTNSMDIKYYYYDANDDKVPFVQNENIYKFHWAEVLAMVDLCKMGSFTFGSICKLHESDCFMYALDGNGYVGLDPYGSYRKFVPIDRAIEILTAAVREDDYRRFPPALAMLEFFKLSWGDNAEHLGVLEYGH